MSKLSPRFVELWTRSDRCLDMDEYMTCQSAYIGKFESGVLWNTVTIVVGIVLGLWALAQNVGVLAALAFLVAGRSYFKSSQQMLMAEILSTQQMLAMLVNGQRRELAEMRKIMNDAEEYIKVNK